jgi:hypothetical protein
VWVFGDQGVAVTRQGDFLLELRVTVTLRLFSPCKGGAGRQEGRSDVWEAPGVERVVHALASSDDSDPTAGLG